MTIIVDLSIDPKFAARFAPLLSVRSQLQDMGISLEQGAQKSDMRIIQAGPLWNSANDLLNDGCAIIFDRDDAATLNPYPVFRHMIQDSRVRIWIKEYTLRDPALHNAPTISGRYHHMLIGDRNEGVDPELPRVSVPASALCKIRTLMPVYAYPTFDPLRTLARNPLNKRRIDIFYAGTVQYMQPTVTRHRLLAGTALEQLEPSVNRLVGYGRVFQKNQFRQTLTDAKIFLSPFGLGEFSWKDYEAIYAGCVLIKPDAGFVTTYGFDIYQNDRYCVRCRHDFSDLSDIVERILSNKSQYQELADRAHSDVLDACKLETHAVDIADVIREALG